MKMKRIFRTLCGLLLASVAMTSCLGDDDEQVTTYSDVAITQFTLGTLNRYTTATSATTGNDTVLKTTVSGSSYKMTIDQLGHQIYNRELLPVGTDVRHVLCTISTRNGGIVALQSMTSDSLSWFSSSDSIDFSVPRTFRVYAIDGSAHRDYVVSVTTSATQGIDFAWQQVSSADQIGQLSEHQVVSFRGQLLLFGSPTGNYSDPDAIYRSADGAQWEPLTPNIRMSHCRGRVSVLDNRLYMVTDEGLYCSDDAQTWQQIRANASLYQPGALWLLIGAGTRELFAEAYMGNDAGHEPTTLMQIVSSVDGGLTWTPDDTEDDIDPYLPPTLFKFGCVTFNYSPTDQTDYVLLVGGTMDATTDGYITPWRKLSNYAQEGSRGQWVSMTVDDANRYALPFSEVYGLVYFDGWVLALCGKSGEQAAIYQSADQGITWKTDNSFALPDGFANGPLSMTATDDALWIVSPTGQTWKGTYR